MASAVSVLRTRILAACRASAVATQAGVLAATWSSTSVPRVFSGLAGMMGGRNRGRLPFLEVDITAQEMTPMADEGGTLLQRVTVRCHVGDGDTGAAGDFSAAILGACAAQIRSQTTDNLTMIGGDDLGEMQAGPWGLQRDLSLTVEQVFARSDYGVT